MLILATSNIGNSNKNNIIIDTDNCNFTADQIDELNKKGSFIFFHKDAKVTVLIEKVEEVKKVGEGQYEKN